MLSEFSCLRLSAQLLGAVSSLSAPSAYFVSGMVLNALSEVPILSSPSCQEAAAIMIPMLELQRLRGKAKWLVRGCVSRVGPE